MIYTKILLTSAALIAASLAFAQTGASVDAKAGVNTGTAVTAPSVTAPDASMPAKTPAASVSGSASASTDPYVQKRETDSDAKKEFKMRKKMAKAEMRNQKRQSARERRAALAGEKKEGVEK